MIALYRQAVAWGADADGAWRYIMWVPGAMLVVVGIAIWWLGEDCPKVRWLQRMLSIG